MSLLKIALPLTLGILLAGCQKQPDPVFPKAGESREVPAFTWVILDEEDLQATYLAFGGSLPEGGKLTGFAAQNQATGAQYVYTLPIKNVDDEQTLVFGHEVLHIILGDYHPKFPGS